MNQDLLIQLSPSLLCPPITPELDFLLGALAFLAILRSFPFVSVTKERSTEVRSPS